MQMQSYLRNIVDQMVSGHPCPAEDLQSMQKGVPEHIISSVWDEVILCLFLEKGDTAYAREGYHDAINLIEKHLIKK